MVLKTNSSKSNKKHLEYFFKNVKVINLYYNTTQQIKKLHKNKKWINNLTKKISKVYLPLSWDLVLGSPASIHELIIFTLSMYIYHTARIHHSPLFVISLYELFCLCEGKVYIRLWILLESYLRRGTSARGESVVMETSVISLWGLRQSLSIVNYLIIYIVLVLFTGSYIIIFF